MGHEQNAASFPLMGFCNISASFNGIGDVPDFTLDKPVEVEMGKIQELLPGAVSVIMTIAVGKKSRIKITADAPTPSTEKKITGGDSFGHQEKKPRPQNLGRLHEHAVKNCFHKSIPNQLLRSKPVEWFSSLSPHKQFVPTNGHMITNPHSICH
jgi:hypothetical protein